VSDKGGAVVEFALVVPLVLALILCLVEIALVARIQLEVVNAAREGARQAATSPDPADVVAAARSVLGRDGPSARVSVRRPDVVGSLAEVRVTVPYRVAAPLFGGVFVEITARAAMRVER
jgi:Flp pilus assembly protein TadG